MLKYLKKIILLSIYKKELLIKSNQYKYFVFLFVLLLILSGCNLGNKSSSKSQDQPVRILPTANDDFF